MRYWTAVTGMAIYCAAIACILFRVGAAMVNQHPVLTALFAGICLLPLYFGLKRFTLKFGDPSHAQKPH